MGPFCFNTRKKSVSAITDVQNEKCYEDTEQLQVRREPGGKAVGVAASAGENGMRITGRGSKGNRDVSKAGTVFREWKLSQE